MGNNWLDPTGIKPVLVFCEAGCPGGSAVTLYSAALVTFFGKFLSFIYFQKKLCTCGKNATVFI
jgi:hypothetical protein